MQHLGEVRFAAAEKTADPGSRLFRLASVAGVGVKDASQSPPVLPFADKMLKFETQGSAFLDGQGLGYGDDAII